jgi:hypothetical protein
MLDIGLISKLFLFHLILGRRKELRVVEEAEGWVAREVEVRLERGRRRVEAKIWRRRWEARLDKKQGL